MIDQTMTLPNVTLAPEPALPAWALKLAREAVVLRANRKTCMLVIRFDGLAWQLFDARPTVKIAG